MQNFDYENVLFCDKIKFHIKSKNLAGLKLIRFLNKLNHVPVYSTIGELACGVGTFTKFIKHPEKKFKVIGIDISQKALTLASHKITNVEFIRADIGYLPCQNKSFDMLCGFDFLEHVKNIDTVFSEIKRVLKQGGIIHFHIPCEGQSFCVWNILKKINRKFNLKEIHAGHIQSFSFDDIIKLCSTYGFEVLDTKYSYHFFGQLLDMIQWSAYALGNKSESFHNFYSENTNSVRHKKWSLFFLFLYIYRSVIKILEIISYYESLLLSRCKFSMSVDITAKKL
jgi:ubiquinone/menaquinone biosynthesis C-methylase UbiE